MHCCHKDEISIWCEGRKEEQVEREPSASKKQKVDSDTLKPSSKRLSIRDQVDSIFLNLKKAHGTKYDAKQY